MGLDLPNNYLIDNDFIKEFMTKLSPKDRDVIGSAIPYMSNVMGDWIINPSSVSLSTFQKMVYTDPIIGGCLDYNMAIISNSIGEYYHDNAEIQAYIRKCFKKLKGGKDKLIRKMLSAMWAGFYVGEKVYATDYEGVYIERVLSTPPLSIIFSVDAEGRVKDFAGINQYILNAFNSGYANSFGFGGLGTNGSGQPDAFAATGDMDYPYRTLALNPVGLVPFPTKKCLYYVLEGVDGLDNPYGRSMLRRVYSYYVLKYALLQFMAFAYDRKSSPLLLLFTDAQQSITIQNGAQTETVNAFEAGKLALKNVRGNTGMVLPGMKGQVYDVLPVNIEGNFDAFVNGIELLDREIQKGLLIPESMFSSSEGGSYALGNSQSSVHNKLLSSIRESIIETLIAQYVRPLIEMNFTAKDHSHDWGMIKEELFNLDDLTKLSNIYTSLINTKIVAQDRVEDKNLMREQFSFPEINETDIQDYFKQDAVGKPNQEDNKNHYKKRAEGV